MTWVKRKINSYVKNAVVYCHIKLKTRHKIQLKINCVSNNYCATIVWSSNCTSIHRNTVKLLTLVQKKSNVLNS